MALGDNRFGVSAGLDQAFSSHAVSVSVSRSQAGVNIPRDKFGDPIQAPVVDTISILVNKAEETIKPTEAGGKPVEVLEFYALPSMLNEGDEITWNGHEFRTSAVWPFGLGGMTQLVSCKAEREVDK